MVKGYDLPKRGGNPKGIVIHNDAGSKGATAEAYRNGLVNAPLSRLRQVLHIVMYQVTQCGKL